MLKESVDFLDVKDGGIYVDCTLGGGGHTNEILLRLNGTGRIIAIDRDPAAIKNAEIRFAGVDNLTVVHSSFDRFDEILDELKIDLIDGAIIDLGISSYQIDTPERGFSYMQNAPLDMRMDSSEIFTAYNIVNEYSENELVKIFFEYGEEKFARRIAAAIVSERAKKPVETTAELVGIISGCVPKFDKSGHPAKRTFQAIRIEVNNELGQIGPTLRSIVDRLKSGGNISVISFHSLEDTIVKKVFAGLGVGCICPKDFPVCVCGNKPKIKLLTKKPVIPSEEENNENTRSHSAKLRAATRI